MYIDDIHSVTHCMYLYVQPHARTHACNTFDLHTLLLYTVGPNRIYTSMHYIRVIRDFFSETHAKE